MREVLERDLLRAVDGLPVEGAAEGPAAEEHGALLLHAVGLGRHAGAHPSRALRRGARAGRARGQPDGGDHRQPERQGGSKGGSALDPQGYDAGKKVTGRKRHILVDTLGLLLNVVVHPADVQDRDGARRSCSRTRGVASPSSSASSPMPAIRDRSWPTAVAKTGTWTLEIVKRNDAASLRRPAQTLDRRAHLRLDQPQPPPGPRLRALRPNRRRLRPPRHDPHHAPTLDQANPLLMNPNLLGSALRSMRPVV